MNSIRRKLIGLFPKIAGSYITVLTPHSGAQILIGGTLSITGITDFPIGTEFDVFLTQNGNTTFIGKALVRWYSSTYQANLFGLLNWTVAGEAGSATFTVSYEGISDSHMVTLIAPQPKLSIESSVSADTPTQYVHHTDVSISSTVTADTPTNI